MADHDDVRPELPQSFVAKPHPVHGPRAEIFHDDVAQRDQPAREFFPSGVAEVETDRELV